MPPTSNKVGIQLGRLIHLWGDPTQEEVAKRLGVRREYISRILNGLEPSEQLRRAIEVSLMHAEENDEPTMHEWNPPPTSVREEPAVAESILSDVQSEIEKLIALAGADVGRLGWLREELRALSGRVQWRLSPGELRAATLKVAELKQQAADGPAMKPNEGQRHG